MNVYNKRNSRYIPGESKKVPHLLTCGIKGMWPMIIITKMLIDQSKATSDEKIVCGKVTHLSDSKIIKYDCKGCVREWRILR